MNGPLTDQIERAKLWLGNGYRPVPCLRHDAPATFIRHGKEIKNSPGKRPHLKLWVGDLAKVYNATADSIEGWRNLRNIGTYPNTGLACGWAIGADVDVYEPALAAATEALVLEHLGATPLRRIGQAPKALLLYRAATEPLGKASTAVFANNAGQTAQLEIMGQGQQIVAHGMHPCGSAYTWGEQSPDDTPLSDLPAVTAEQVALLIADAEVLFRERGLRPKAEPPPEAAAASPSPKPRGTADHAGGPFRAVNDAAMADLSRWVPHLFGYDAREDRHGGYRVSSDALGRELEEDISISPAGIVDFGVHDMGDTNLGKRTPIDLVMEHGNAADAIAAAKWLAGHIGTPFELPHQVDTHWQDADPHATGHTVKAKPNGHDAEAQPKSSEKRKSADSAKPKPKAEPPLPIFYTEAELAKLELPIPQYVIDEILTVGLYILAATPKLGKSWLNLAAGRAVATGTLFGGSRRVRQGPVLFLDLEGNQRRAQKRSALLRAGAEPSPDFHMIHTWPPMQSGGLELLERAIVAKGAILAMIDVWACFRPPRPKNADPYQWDHESAKLVAEVAHRTNCAVVITHHNRKAEAEDFTAQVSGTAGLTGAADGIITLSRKRGEADAVMKVTGRDVEERELALSFKDGKWTILGEAADVLMSKTRQSIHSTLHFAGKPMKPAEVAQALGLKPENVRQTLIRMLREGTVKADTSGRYTPAEPGQMQ